MKLPVEDTLDSLRIEILKEDGDERWALCPGHRRRTGREDHNPSWSINVRTGAHYCFSCHWKGNLVTLVRELKGDAAAERLMAETKQFGRPVSVNRTVRRCAGWRRNDPIHDRGSRLPKSWLAVYDRPPEWALKSRRLDLASVVAYDVRWDPQREAWVLPLYESDLSRLIGYQVKAQQGRFFRNQPRGMDKSATLFGLGTAQGDVVVVESPLDAVLLHRLGYEAVAICGSRVSDTQYRLLQQYDSIIYALDNDGAGQREHKRLSKMGRARFLRYDGPEKDVGEMPDAAIRSALDRCRSAASAGMRR